MKLGLLGILGSFVFNSLFCFSLGASEPCSIATARLYSKVTAEELKIDADAHEWVYFLVGKPAAHKGTNGRPLAKLLNIPYQSTGDVLRAIRDSGTPLGLRIGEMMRAQQNIATSDLIPVLEQWLSTLDIKKGIIIDGSPRKLLEAAWLKKLIIEKGWRGIRVLYFDATDETVHFSAAGRLTCSKKTCGEIYHTISRPPLQPAICDECGSSLTRREDDLTPEGVQKRIETFHADTGPVIDYFKKDGTMYTINSNQSMDQVWRDVLKILKTK